MLGSLAAIALVLISFLPLMEILGHPLPGMLALVLVHPEIAQPAKPSGSTEKSAAHHQRVTSYGQALESFAIRLKRLRSKERLFVVWLFDESESMKDDQHEVKKRMESFLTKLGGNMPR